MLLWSIDYREVDSTTYTLMIFLREFLGILIVIVNLKHVIIELPENKACIQLLEKLTKVM